MADVEVGDVIRLTAVMDHDYEGTVQNVWHVLQSVDTATQEDFMDDVADRMNAAYNNLDNFMPDSLSFQEIRGYNITQDEPLPTVNWPTLTVGQVDAAEPLPSVMSALGLMRTGTPKVLGKKYFGPFTDANINNTEWTSGITSAVLQALISMTTAWSSGGGQAEAGVWSEKLETWIPVIERVARSVAAYQRRRKQGRGA